MILEACIETLQEAQYAYENGAHQLEVCSQLEFDGLTPSHEFVVSLQNSVPLPLNIMVRCRGENFEYSDDEMEEMVRSIHSLKTLNPHGFVLGCTQKTAYGEISLDIDKIRILADAAYPYPVTIHKAIDICTDILQEVDKLKLIDNIKFILTSGGAPTAEKGVDLIKKMKELSAPHIKIRAAGKVTKDNIDRLHSSLGLEHYHGRKIV